MQTEKPMATAAEARAWARREDRLTTREAIRAQLRSGEQHRDTPEQLAVHAENRDIAAHVIAAAISAGMGVTRFSWSLRTGHFDGYSRYAAFYGPRPFGTRSVAVLRVFDSRYVRFYAPSKSDERASLAALETWLDGHRS